MIVCGFIFKFILQNLPRLNSKIKSFIQNLPNDSVIITLRDIVVFQLSCFGSSRFF